jgi:hypothetical protein
MSTHLASHTEPREKVPTRLLPSFIPADLHLPPAVREKLEAVARFDFTPVTSTLSDRLIRAGRTYSCEQAYPILAEFGKADQEIATLLELEFKKFVMLTLIKPGITHAPPGPVDMYWHYLILHTETYADFCCKVWGDANGWPGLRNHYPATDDTRSAMRDAYIRTRALYEAVFGPARPYRKPDGAAVAIRPPGEDASGDS